MGYTTRTMKNKASIEQMCIGDEPMILDTITNPSDGRLVRALNWYNYMYNVEKGKPWLLQYLKKAERINTAEMLKHAPNWRTPTTICWMAKMMLNGTKFEGALMDYFNRKVAEATEKAMPSVIKAQQPKVVVDIQARVRENANKRIGEIESEIDVVMKGGSFDTYNYLTKNEISSQIAGMINDHFTKHLNFLKSDDPQIAEAYGDKLKMWVTFYTQLVGDCDRYINNKKGSKIRKPRAKKEKLATDLVKGLKHQKNFSELKLVSVNPVDIIGAESLWVYNTKYKQLTVYYCSGRSGLSVKGTTLVGFDQETSETKTLRKPEETLKTLLAGGKIVQKKLLAGLSTKGSKPNGRINDQTILLKVNK